MNRNQLEAERNSLKYENKLLKDIIELNNRQADQLKAEIVKLEWRVAELTLELQEVRNEQETRV